MFYVMLIGLDEIKDPKFTGVAYTQVECYGVFKYAYDGVRVELRDVRGWNDSQKAEATSYRDRATVIEKLSWTMHVDNPPAEGQFVAGKKYFRLHSIQQIPLTATKPLLPPPWSSEQFIYWLQGFAELNPTPPSEAQWKSIKEHLATVFDEKITPAVKHEISSEEMETIFSRLPRISIPKERPRVHRSYLGEPRRLC